MSNYLGLNSSLQNEILSMSILELCKTTNTRQQRDESHLTLYPISIKNRMRKTDENQDRILEENSF